MHPTTLITIDYLIINLMGDIVQNKQSNSLDFEFITEPFGTKTFSVKQIVKYKNERIGTILSIPRSNIIPEKLTQLQFENHIFYSKSLTEIKEIIYELVSNYTLTFSSINRLDIAYDINDNNNYYRNIVRNLNNKVYKMAGRTKAFSAHSEFVKGVSINNGFSLGSRSSSKFLRCYNKTLSLEIKEKQYIIDFYNKNNFENKNVWRFEYQLNSTFFTNLKNYGHDKDFFDASKEKLKLPFEDLTWSIFDYGALINLTMLAQNNFFDIRKNTNKSQTNKEKKIKFIIDFDYLLSIKSNIKYTFVRLKKTHYPTITKKKRLIKALFREYCSEFQNITYIVALNKLLLYTNPFDNKPLSEWFNQKMSFYLAEFKELEKMNIKFDYSLYNEQSNLFIE